MKLLVIISEHSFVTLLSPNSVKLLDVVHGPVGSAVRVARQEWLISLMHPQLHLGILLHSLGINLVFFVLDGEQDGSESVLDAVVVGVGLGVALFNSGV